MILPKTVKEMNHRAGVDVVFDPIGGDIWRKSLQSAAFGARVCIVGWASNVKNRS